MRKLLTFLLSIPSFCIAQSTTENYTKKTTYKQEFRGNYVNFSQSISTPDIIYSNMGGGSGNLIINNNLLTFNFSGSWSVNYARLKQGIIKDMAISPNIPYLELGPIFQIGTSIETGYSAKIENNKLIFYSPYFLKGFSANLTQPIPGGSPNYSVSISNLYTCPSGSGGGGGGSGSVTISGGNINLNASGGWSDLCNLKMGQIIYLATSTIPNMDLGVIKTSFGLDSAYRAKIENNWLVFYSPTPIPTLPSSASLNYSSNFGISPNNIVSSVIYFDGIGREKQIVDGNQSSSNKNIITHIEYDLAGRKSKEYLPYKSDVLNLNYVPNSLAETLLYYSNPTFISSGDLNFETTNFPYSETLYEAGPINKILKKSMPGSDWKIGSGHETKFDYATNISNEVRKFKVVYDSEFIHHIEPNGFYSPSQLSKNIVKDENWTSSDGHNKTTQEFKDKDGNVVLVKKFEAGLSHNTYYVFDDVGNLSYVIPPTASDDIDLVYGGSAVVNRYSPWTNIVQVDAELAEDFNRLYKEYNNELILSNDLYTKYGGQGGFSLITDSSNRLTLSINISLSQPVQLKTGTILTLKDVGEFKDVELGRISGLGFEYIFLIKDNTFFIEGEGKLSSLNQTFTGDTKLIYNTNYSWAELVEIDPKESDNYILQYKQLNNEDILSANIENIYGATGGINVIIDENDAVSANLNIISNTPLKFKKGIVIPLKSERRISDRELMSIENGDTRYRFSIKENNLFIEGDGDFTNINRIAPIINPPLDILDMPQDILEGLCFEYRYDNRNRLIEKRIPGKGWEYIVYDKLNRPVLVQDPSLRLLNKWLFTKYDVFGRIIYTGEFKFISPTGTTDSNLRNEIQSLVNSNSISNESRSINSFAIAGLNINYTNTIFPNNSNTDFTVFTVNYYDDYNFMPFGQTIVIPTSVYSLNSNIQTNVKSLSTASIIRVLGTNQWILNVNAYDKKSKLVWSKASNSFTNVDNTTEILYDFTGKVIESKTTTVKSGDTPIIVVDRFTYDHADRILKKTQQINGNPEEMILFNKFDELGRQVQKKVGGSAPASTLTFDNVTTSLQTVDYSYNVRGWLKSINNPDALLTDDLFALRVNYNTPQFGATSLYNGNISESSWRTLNDNKNRVYKYEYDALSRIKYAEYVPNYALPGTDDLTIESFHEGNIDYDKNGNIIHLDRFGLKSNNIHYDQIDNLSYSYFPRSNKLKKVDDFALDSNGFKDVAGDDYEYDINGNLKKDLNKGITNIIYNHLNLPTKIVFNYEDSATSSHPITIEYVYDALGVKQSKTFMNSIYDGSAWLPTTITSTIYSGKFTYQNNILQFISNSEGYAIKNGSIFSYIYQYKDHLGNVRLSYKRNSSGILEIIEESNYYAFGLKQQGYNNIYNPLGNDLAQKYKFNNKELQEELGLNWYDYNARNYDVAIGRWMNIDPLAEKYTILSPYSFVANNPLNAIDPDGRRIIFVNGYYNTGDGLMPKYLAKNVIGNVGLRGYWGVGFLQGASEFFNNDTSYSFVDGRGDWNSTGSERFDAGYEYAKANFAMLTEGLAEGETIKIVSHSMGAAYSEGMLKYFSDKKVPVEQVVHLSSADPSEFKASKFPTLQLDLEFDSVLAFKNENDGLDYKISGVDRYATVKTKRGMIDDWVSSHADTKFNKSIWKMVADLQDVEFEQIGNTFSTPYFTVSGYSNTYRAKGNENGTVFKFIDIHGMEFKGAKNPAEYIKITRWW